MLELTDTLLHVLHITVILINLTFWMSFRTLRIAQVTLGLTMLSWAGFGYFYGFGYCFLTDWHWRLKERLGETHLPASYIKLVVDRAFNTDSDPDVINKAAVYGILFGILGCLVQTLRAALRKRGG